MNCTSLKVGDFVWTGTYRRERERVRRVERVTNTMLILSPFKDRYYLKDGTRVGRFFDCDSIRAKATHEEVINWNDEQARQKNDREKRERAQAREEKYRQELINLFGNYTVSISKEFNSDGYHLTIYSKKDVGRASLSDEEIADIADKLNKK